MPTPPRFNFPRKGDDYVSTLQTIKAQEFFADTVVEIVKDTAIPSYVAGTVGDPHPDTENRAGYYLDIVIPDPPSHTARFVYVKNRGPLVSYQRTAEGQVETVTRTLEADDVTFPVLSALVTTASVENLANTKAIQTVGTVPIVFGANTFSKEIPDVVPERFRVAIPTVTVSDVEAGTAAAPTLDTGDLAKSEEQLDVFKKRVRTTSRVAVEYPVVLTSTKLTGVGQVETVTETLDDSIQTVTGSATTVEGNVLNLGDGTSLLTVGTVPSVFGNASYTSESPAYPAEFVTGESTTAVTGAGTAASPSAPTGGRATSEQVTLFVKRDTTTTPTLGKTLSEKATNQFKQLVTVARVADGTVGSPSATAEVEQTSMPGGRTMAVTKTVSGVFDAHSFSVEIPDPVPQEFRSSVPTETETTRSAATIVSLPSLTPNQLRVTTSREDSFTIRTDTTTRDNGTLPVLAGQEYNRELDVAIPFTEEVAAVSSGARTDSQPLSDSLSRNKTYDPSAISGIENTWYGVVEHSFPDELLSAVVSAGGTGQINVEVKVTDGYSGPCDARFTETFVSGPPGSAAGITPFFPQSFYGHMSLKDFSISGIAVQLPPGGLLIETIPVRIPKCLHGGIDLSFDVYGITGGDGTSGTPYTFGSLGTVSFGTIEATSPTSLPHGAYILKAVEVTRAGYGMWRVVVVEVKVP